MSLATMHAQAAAEYEAEIRRPARTAAGDAPPRDPTTAEQEVARRRETAPPDALPLLEFLPLDPIEVDTSWRFINDKATLGDVGQYGTLDPGVEHRTYHLKLGLRLESVQSMGRAFDARKKALADRTRELALSLIRPTPEFRRIAELAPLEYRARRARDAAAARVQELRARGEWLRTVSPPPADIAVQLQRLAPEADQAAAELRDRESEYSAFAPLYAEAHAALSRVALPLLQRARQEVAAVELAHIDALARELLVGMGDKLTELALVSQLRVSQEEFRAPDRIVELLEDEVRVGADEPRTE